MNQAHSPTPDPSSLMRFPMQLAQAALQWVERMPPPPWLLAEGQQRIVLVLNHVLQGEAEAMDRLRRHAGKTVRARWRAFEMGLRITSVGLLDVHDFSANPNAPDLGLELVQTELADLVASVQSGQTPKLRIEGDVQLAAEVGWLSQHVRWDVEDDLSRVLGPAAAGTLAQIGRGVFQAFRSGKPFA